MTFSYKFLPLATKPGRSVFLLLNCRDEPARFRTEPPADSIRATPAATSHSFFGVSVQVASTWPAAEARRVVLETLPTLPVAPRYGWRLQVPRPVSISHRTAPGARCKCGLFRETRETHIAW